jgi:hypothetical protein
MDQVVKSYNAAIKSGMSKCEAIRAVVQEFIDIPRGEMQKVLVEGCKLNPGTVRTQCQLGRTMANKAEQPVAKAPANQAEGHDAGRRCSRARVHAVDHARAEIEQAQSRLSSRLDP